MNIELPIAKLVRIAKTKTYLTAREMEILTMCADGLNNKQIASALYITTDTVDTHNRSIIGYLEARNMKNAIAIAFRSKLID